MGREPEHIGAGRPEAILRRLSGAMFRTANATARQFTKPVVISSRTLGGKCSAGIGSFVVINEEGWIVTAHHIVEEIVKLTAAAEEVRHAIAKREKVENDKSLSRTQKKKLLSKLPRPNKKSAIHTSSVWWGGIGNGQPVAAASSKYFSVPAVDLAVAKLEPFDPKWVTNYPIFKDPSKGYEPGQSLCKLGFSLHEITPNWREDVEAFELPSEALPIPFFPIDGILTRFANVVVKNAAPPPFPLLWIETSSPGIKGQSGGPIFDTKGTVWGIQVRTHSYELGFNAGTTEQYLNVGLGVHATTLIEFFKTHKIKFQLSSY